MPKRLTRAMAVTVFKGKMSSWPTETTFNKAPIPHIVRRARSLRSLKGMKIRTTNTSVMTNPAHDRATLAAWLCVPRVLRMYGEKTPKVPAARFQNRYTVAVNTIAARVGPDNRLRKRLAASGSAGTPASSGCASGSVVGSASPAPDAAVQMADSTMPRLRAHVTIATTNRLAKTILLPSTPYEESANASRYTTMGPRLQATWLRPRSLPRALLGENSPMSASEVGTSAPTATPTMKVPTRSIGRLNENTISKMPKA